MLVSAYAFGGVPAQALKGVLRSADLYVSPDMLLEYREVPERLRASGKLNAEQRRSLVAGIATFVAEARVVIPTKVVTMCRDAADNMVLEVLSCGTCVGPDHWRPGPARSCARHRPDRRFSTTVHSHAPRIR